MRLERKRHANETVITVRAFVFSEGCVNYQPVATIRRRRHNGGLVYILLDTRDWFVSSYDTLREAVERASSHKF